MPECYKPDLGTNPDNPFARDGDGKLVQVCVQEVLPPEK